MLGRGDFVLPPLPSPGRFVTESRSTLGQIDETEKAQKSRPANEMPQRRHPRAAVRSGCSLLQDKSVRVALGIYYVVVYRAYRRRGGDARVQYTKSALLALL